MKADDDLIARVWRVNVGKDPSGSPITLLVHGVLVTGDLISVDEYAERMTGKRPEPPTSPDTQVYEFEHLHLRNVTTFGPGGGSLNFHSDERPDAMKPTWRIRLASVDGFISGRASRAQE